MALPLLAGLGAIYSVGRLVDEGRYWYDYAKNTGHVPRYFFRTTNFGSGVMGSLYWTNQFPKFKRRRY